MPWVDGVEHRFVEARGIRFHVAGAGEGPPLMFVHGFPQHWYAWRHLVPLLADRYRLVMPDLRGAGWSDAPYRGYGTRDRAADVLALMDALGLDRVGLIGHEWGAWAGFRACLDAPDRFTRFLALNIVHPWPPARHQVGGGLGEGSNGARTRPGGGGWVRADPEHVAVLVRGLSVATAWPCRNCSI
ncbi:alpha/beta fold hydrolase [Actinomadura sp. NPDC048955]|uniref:alpha/beta fold hydrolase n=1 Tax=Actinomadura sp. NPDC048955 TaxID=3158228 RepID=UPI0033CF5B75